MDNISDNVAVVAEEDTPSSHNNPHQHDMIHHRPLHSDIHDHDTYTLQENTQNNDNSYISFLDNLARTECHNLPCKEHNNVSYDDAVYTNDKEGRAEERRRYMTLLDFESDNDDMLLESDTTDDYFSSSEEEEEEEVENDEVDDAGEEHQQPEEEELQLLIAEEGDQNDTARLNNNDLSETTNNFSSQQQSLSIELQQQNETAMLQQLLSPSSSPMTNNGNDGNNHKHISNLLSSLANSEEVPLIRADIPWSVITYCDATNQKNQLSNMDILTSDTHHNISAIGLNPKSKPSLLRKLYNTTTDPNGARLLQGVLRMDPPLDAVKVLLDAFPLSCLDMEGFFTACQFAHPNTSRRLAGKSDDVNDMTSQPLSQDETCDLDDDDTDDVGEVVKLVMHATIRVRKLNSIDWGMVAFLGDARISPPHAKLLLRNVPEALIDPKHGAFGVSPLDRMASGVFIHGSTMEWVEKLRLALRVAAYVRMRRKQQEEERQEFEPFGSPFIPTTTQMAKIVLPRGFFHSDSQLFRRRESEFDRSTSQEEEDKSFHRPTTPAQSFYPYHELIRLLTSANFQGNKFGKHGFLQTLRACTQSDPDAFLRPDNEGNLPIHIALRSECESVLGVKGERRLIKYLLDLDPHTSLCPEGIPKCDGLERRLPLRLSVENAWPVYDLIINSAFKCCDDNDVQNYKHESSKSGNELSCKDYIRSKIVLDKPLLHDALDGPYHSRFGIHGARQLTRNIMKKNARQRRLSQGSSEVNPYRNLTSFLDSNGRTALHIALESKWPVADLIVKAKPSFALDYRDPVTKLLPFQLAACSYTSPCLPNATLEMSMLFELIKESPLCVASDANSKPNSTRQEGKCSTIVNINLKKRRRSPPCV